MFDIILNLEDLDRKAYFDKFENFNDSNAIGLSSDISVSGDFGTLPFSNDETNN